MVICISVISVFKVITVINFIVPVKILIFLKFQHQAPYDFRDSELITENLEYFLHSQFFIHH